MKGNWIYFSKRKKRWIIKCIDAVKSTTCVLSQFLKSRINWILCFVERISICFLTHPSYRLFWQIQYSGSLKVTAIIWTKLLIISRGDMYQQSAIKKLWSSMMESYPKSFINSIRFLLLFVSGHICVKIQTKESASSEKL